MGISIEPAIRQDAKMNSLTLLLFCLIVGTNALSFQGHDVETNEILVDGHMDGRNATEDPLKNEERRALENQRLIVLGRLTKKVLEWLYYNSEDLREWILQNLKNCNVDLKLNLRMKRSLNIKDEDLDWMNAVNHDYDAFMTTMGAVLDLEDCRKQVFCGTCTLIKDVIPG